MRKRNVIKVIGVIALMAMMNTQVFANWAQVTASLPADKKTVSSGYKAFQPGIMYGEVMPISKYPIKYQAYGKNSIGNDPNFEGQIIISPGANSSKVINSNLNMHQITITGWDVNTAVKGCIGYGYITD